jgi:hypothetical protein
VFPLPLSVTVKPSRKLRLGIGALHLLAMVAVWLAALPLPAQIAGSLLLSLSLFLGARPAPETTLRGKADGTLEIRHQDTWQEIGPVSPGLVLPIITILPLRGPVFPRPRHLVILDDSLPPEDFRRLRVWIQWLGKRPKVARSSGIPRSQSADPDLAS